MAHLKDKDAVSGIVFMALGVGAIVVAGENRLGSLTSMGPGFFPTTLGMLLTLLGLVTLVRSFVRKGGPIGSWPVRPLVFLPVAVLVFAVLVRPAGLVVAALALVLISAVGGWEFRLREALALAVGLTVVTIGVFVLLLGLPLRIWPI